MSAPLSSFTNGSFASGMRAPAFYSSPPSWTRYSLSVIAFSSCSKAKSWANSCAEALMKPHSGLKWPALNFVSRFLQPILAVFAGLCLGLAVTWIAGENPWHVFKILCLGAFGSSYDFGMTLSYATPLVFTGLSVAIAFHAGLFNIGAEGQLTLGALAAAAAGAIWPASPIIL